MNLKNLSPKAEPITWATVIALTLAALASYGFGVTPETKELILVVGPLVLGNIIARFNVFAPDTVEQIKAEEFAAGHASSTERVEPLRARPSTKPQEGIARYTRPGA